MLRLILTMGAFLFVVWFVSESVEEGLDPTGFVIVAVVALLLIFFRVAKKGD